MKLTEEADVFCDENDFAYHYSTNDSLSVITTYDDHGTCVVKCNDL